MGNFISKAIKKVFVNNDNSNTSIEEMREKEIKEYIKLNNLSSTINLKDISQKKTSAKSVIIQVVKRLGFRFGDVSSKDFEPPEYDLLDIDNAYDTESYVRQAVDKYVEQMFKEGYQIYGANPNAVEYIKTRLRYIAICTNNPFQTFLNEIVESIVKYQNAIIVKARKTDESQMPPGVTVNGIDGAEPIAGYFVLHPGTFQVKRDKNGTITGWQQEVEGGDKPQKFKPEDVIHIHYKRRLGNAFGTPFLHSVMNDIRALRFLEETVIDMVYRHCNPFIHVSVGDNDSPGTDDEINDAENKMNNLENNGGVATTNRVKIQAIETNKVVDAMPYISYLESRVFTGFGIAEVKFGRGSTANRNTADSMTDEMSDRIKAFQNVVETGFNFYIIRYLLIEGGFDPDNNLDDTVTFEFLENDLDRKVKSETHSIYKYEHNAITEDEMRTEIGHDPISDRAKMHQTLITQENAKVLSSFSDNEATSSGSKETNNKQKPQNQHGTKTSPKKETNSELLKLVKKNKFVKVANILNIPLFASKTICAVFGNIIDIKRIDNDSYVEDVEERIKYLVDYYINKNNQEGKNVNN